MQVFKTFFKILNKKKHQLIIYFVIFGGLLGIMSNMGGNQRGDFEDSKLNVVVFDYDHSKESKYLMEYIYSIHEKVEVIDDKEEIQDLLYYQVLDYVLYIEEGYAKEGTLSNIKRQGSESGAYVDGQIASYQKAFRTYMAAGFCAEEANEKVLVSLDNDGLVGFLGASKEKPKLYYYFTYMAYILIMLLMNALSPIIMVFNNKEIHARNVVSPMTTREKSGQLIVACGLFSIVAWVVFMAVGMLLFQQEFLQGKNPYNMLNSVVFLLMTVGMVSIISSFELKAQAISGISIIVGLGMAFLGGVFVPMEIFSDNMMNIAKFVPTYWYVTACDSLYKDGAMDTFWQCITVELLYVVAFVAIALVISKLMKQKNS